MKMFSLIGASMLIASFAQSAELPTITVNYTNQAEVPAAILTPALNEAAGI